MTAELLPAPKKLTRVWDKDFNLVHLFRADEDLSNGLPLNHPVAKLILDAAERSHNVYMTVDEDGARWSGSLHMCLVEKVGVGSAPRMKVHWTET
ncbi:hypothetical protein [Nocardia asiatica]|uniref:hypothetical protein n=1 Tax=Nocardia asiatica TaxID=209252 RepID=UPI0024570DBB|nr:hypothetical protein [Nocardia asiatica]